MSGLFDSKWIVSNIVFRRTNNQGGTRLLIRGGDYTYTYIYIYIYINVCFVKWGLADVEAVVIGGQACGRIVQLCLCGIDIIIHSMHTIMIMIMIMIMIITSSSSSSSRSRSSSSSSSSSSIEIVIVSTMSALWIILMSNNDTTRAWPGMPGFGKEPYEQVLQLHFEASRPPACVYLIV